MANIILQKRSDNKPTAFLYEIQNNTPSVDLNSKLTAFNKYYHLSLTYGHFCFTFEF